MSEVGAGAGVYRRAEVATRNGNAGAPVWLIYKDYVYDVTAYVDEHPGGDVLLEEAGRDATAAFDDVGHSPDARTVLAKYKIGQLVEEERRYDDSGKKRRKVEGGATATDAAGAGAGGRSCLSAVTCGLL